MNHPLSRRDFLAATAASAAAASGLLAAGRSQAAEFTTKLCRAMIRSPNEQALAFYAALGAQPAFVTMALP